MPPQWARLEATDPVRIGDFVLLAKRRPGGRAVATFYGASTIDETQRVVIKVYSKTEVLTIPGYARDLDITSRLQSPFIARTNSVIEASSAIAVVREYIPGWPLDQVLEAYPGGLPWPQLLELADNILEGLAALHSKNVVHGAMWPGNIIIGETPVLADVALVEPLPKAPDFPDMEISRRYQSPEQRAGRIVSAASDVYSWAMLVLAAAQGVLFSPEPGVDPTELELSGIHRRLVTLLKSAMAPDAGHRPSAAHLLRRLRKIRRPRWDASISGLFPEATLADGEPKYDPLARPQIFSSAWIRQEYMLLRLILRAPSGPGVKLRRLLIGLGASDARFAALAACTALLSVPLAVAVDLLLGVWR
jgi:serine/threonine protein kinase